ncbi:hypothetical protein SH2C18_52160 [Clostridium sediminicola]|uniref:dipeptidase n=1 Tax=Clostridium sediminicola TaxID=3114879 RepID=UPI0031F240A7
MDINAQKLHKESIVVDAHQEIWNDYVHEKLMGKKKCFEKVYAPRLKKGGVNILNLVIGGDHTAQPIDSASDFHFWDTNKFIDLLYCDQEDGDESFIICKNARDIDKAVETGKFGLILSIAGARVIEGRKKNVFLFSELRNLYRLGLRSVQLTGNGRNKLADGVGQACTKAGLTRFGIATIEEMERLGMILDLAQLSEYGFESALKYATKPFIDSHSCAYAISNHPRNISDERIKEMGKRGCVIGVSFWAALVNNNSQAPTMDDLLKQIDYIVSLAGIDSVALGPDYSGFMWPKNLKGFMNLGPEDCEFDSLRPTHREKYPGYIQGVYYGDRESDYIKGADTTDKFYMVTEALLKHGYSETDIKKILGGNMMRIYREVLR